jgi:hypothetical protein
LVAFTFLGAFGMTILTVVLTGLWVRSPAARRVAENSAVVLVVGVPHTVNLAFTSRRIYDDVELTIDLPAGIELLGRAGLRRVVWETSLVAGDNLLPLELVAQEGRGGQLAARLRHKDGQKTFVVEITVTPR